MYESEKVEKGISSLTIVKILVSVAIVAGLLSYGAYKGLHYYKNEQTIKLMETFFEQYQEHIASFVKEDTKIRSITQLKSLGLMQDCETKPSTFNRTKQVCALPLGEIDVSSESNDAKYYSFVYVHLTDTQKKDSCRRFLSNGWQGKLPRKWFGKESYIGVISENTNGRIYFSLNEEWIRQDGAERNPSEEHLKEVCSTCENSRYCSILFAFDFDKELLQPNP